MAEFLAQVERRMVGLELCMRGPAAGLGLDQAVESVPECILELVPEQSQCLAESVDRSLCHVDGTECDECSKFLTQARDRVLEQMLAHFLEQILAHGLTSVLG